MRRSFEEQYAKVIQTILDHDTLKCTCLKMLISCVDCVDYSSNFRSVECLHRTSACLCLRTCCRATCPSRITRPFCIILTICACAAIDRIAIDFDGVSGVCLVAPSSTCGHDLDHQHHQNFQHLNPTASSAGVRQCKNSATIPICHNSSGDTKLITSYISFQMASVTNPTDESDSNEQDVAHDINGGSLEAADALTDQMAVQSSLAWYKTGEQLLAERSLRH